MPKIQNWGKQSIDIVICLNPNSGDLLRKCYSENQAIMG
ncbi:protein of unknown function [Xenorhabdus bovienii]|uniref:Uncharacterized protein n=1 Tax=Xenorhabdus bovienii TaxID=40576 RepID=A0A0B6X8L5_XENBV|nr:protein of unknown function [Xenorhabdus bovienii]